MAGTSLREWLRTLMVDHMPSHSSVGTGGSKDNAQGGRSAGTRIACLKAPEPTEDHRQAPTLELEANPQGRAQLVSISGKYLRIQWIEPTNSATPPPKPEEDPDEPGTDYLEIVVGPEDAAGSDDLDNPYPYPGFDDRHGPEDLGHPFVVE